MHILRSMFVISGSPLDPGFIIERFSCIIRNYYYYVHLPVLCREDFFPFLVCAFKQFETLNPDVGKKCAEEANLVWEKIETCYSGDLGISLEDMFAAETAELKPPHEYVPWVTINGEVSKFHLLSYIWFTCACTLILCMHTFI